MHQEEGVSGADGGSGRSMRRRGVWLAAALAVWACGDGGRAPTDPIDDPDGSDPNALLTDEELQTSADADAETANPAYVSWLEAHHEPIRSLVSDDYSDLRFLEPLLQGKRVVQLGESGHGVAQYNRFKVRLIKYLHEELGYSVLAFESSIYECSRANDETDARAMLEGCIFQVWHTNEVLPLFTWMQEQRTSGDPNPLRLAGFDSQVSSREGLADRPAWFRELVGAVAGEGYADAVHALDSAFVAHYTSGGDFSEWVDSEQDSLVASYRALADTLSQHRQELAAAFPDEPEWPTVAVRTARSMVAFATQLGLPSGSPERVMTRDSTMARNLGALLELYPDRKFITWGHNYHIRYRNEAIPEYGTPTMGTWVHQRHPDDVYTVGFYMYRGTAADNSRSIYALERPGANSLENIAYHVRKRHIFFDVSGVERTEGSAWLFQPIVTHTWGLQDVTLVTRDQYDGILYIDQVGSPSYLR